MERSLEICRSVVQKSVNRNFVEHQLIVPATGEGPAATTATSVMTTIPTVMATATTAVILAPTANVSSAAQASVQPTVTLSKTSTPAATLASSNTARPAVTIKPIPPSAQTMAIVNAATGHIQSGRSGGVRQTSQAPPQASIRLQLPTAPIRLQPATPAPAGGVVVTAVSQAGGVLPRPQAGQVGGPVVVVQAQPPGARPPQLIRLPVSAAAAGAAVAVSKPPATILVSPSPTSAPAPPLGGAGVGGGLVFPVLPSPSASPVVASGNAQFQPQEKPPFVLTAAGAAPTTTGPIVVKKIPVTTPSPPPQQQQRLVQVAAGPQPQFIGQQQKPPASVMIAAASNSGTPLPPQLPSQPLSAAQLQTGSVVASTSRPAVMPAVSVGGDGAFFQRPLPMPQGRVTPTATVKTVVVDSQQQAQQPGRSRNSGTPLPDNLSLPSEPVPISSQEIIKLQPSPKMEAEEVARSVTPASTGDAGTFTPPLASPSARTLSRSSSLASNGSMSPSPSVVNGSAGGGQKQIFVKVTYFN